MISRPRFVKGCTLLQNWAKQLKSTNGSISMPLMSSENLLFVLPEGVEHIQEAADES